MRPADLAWKIVMALRHVSRSTWKEATDPRLDVNSRAVAVIADTAARGLRNLELLSDAPPPQSSETFGTPVARMLGEEVGSGAPLVDDPS